MYKVVYTFDENTEFFSSNSSSSHLNFECQQNGEEEFVHFKQAAGGVLEHRQGQVFNDVVDSLAGDW